MAKANQLMLDRRARDHRARIREEITYHIVEYLSVNNRPEDDINTNEMIHYIEMQTETVLNSLYSGDLDENHPSNVNPSDVEGDYYRESIEEFGSVYHDYNYD